MGNCWGELENRTWAREGVVRTAGYEEHPGNLANASHPSCVVEPGAAVGEEVRQRAQVAVVAAAGCGLVQVAALV